MSRAAFRQAEFERVIRAAERQGACVQIDMRTLVATIIPGVAPKRAVDAGRDSPSFSLVGNFAPDGKDVFDED